MKRAENIAVSAINLRKGRFQGLRRFKIENLFDSWEKLQMPSLQLFFSFLSSAFLVLIEAVSIYFRSRFWQWVSVPSTKFKGCFNQKKYKKTIYIHTYLKKIFKYMKYVVALLKKPHFAAISDIRPSNRNNWNTDIGDINITNHLSLTTFYLSLFTYRVLSIKLHC